ncbi:MAG: hypothetical protein ACM3VT_09665 [Solirubrobacterales bacterium]
MTSSRRRHVLLMASAVLAVLIGRLEANSGAAPVAVSAPSAIASTSESAPVGVQALALPSAVASSSSPRYTGWGMLGDFDEQTPSFELALVIPDKEMDLASVNQIMEDLGIMARIIEKSVLSPYGIRRTEWRAVFGGGYESANVAGPRALFPFQGRPKPLYVSGYGATFFIQVDFPLLPSPDKAQGQPTPSQEDSVWAQTQQSLLAPEAGGAVREGEAAAQSYSQSKVESFRKSLISTMKHASNIRALGNAEWLTFVVQGSAASANSPFGRTVMTLRAKKADVDARSKGELSQEQFEQRVQVINY